MRGYGMDYNRDRSGWMGGTDRGYDAGYGEGWGGRDRGALDYGGWDRGGMGRGSAFQGRGGISRDYGRDYSGMDRGGREHEGGGRFFQHWTDDDVDGWESGRHGMPRNMGRGMSRGGNEGWLDDNGYPRGYRGSGVHNYGGGGRDHFRAYGANFRLGYDPRW